MSGSLGEWSIEDLLQIARITHKTTCIEVEGRPQVSGAIFLRDGAVVDALVDGTSRGGGSRFSQVVEAIETLAAIEDGTFEFSPRSASEVAEPPIEVPAITAAMEKDALREKRLTDLGIDGREGLAIGRHIEGPINIKPAVWQLLADLVDAFSLETLQVRMGRRKAVATLLTLEALGVLERRDEFLSPAIAPQSAPAPTMEVPVPAEPEGSSTMSSTPEDVLFEPEIFESTRNEAPAPLLPDDQNPWITNPPAPSEGASPPAEDRSHADEPIVEIFEPLVGDSKAPPAAMHEVVTPSETTLVSDVLGDMRSRFREWEYVYEDEDD